MWKIKLNTDLLKLISVTIGKYNLSNPLVTSIYNEHRPVPLKYESDSYNHDNRMSVTMSILHTCIRN